MYIINAFYCAEKAWQSDMLCRIELLAENCGISSEVCMFMFI